MAGKSNGANNVETDGWARAPVEHGSFMVRCGRVIYNPDDNSCFGRTPKRWGIVLVFYSVFYAVLAAMFAACMAGLYATLDENKPTFILSSSLIGDNPGVAYRPIPGGGYGFVLNYHVSNVTESHPYITQLAEFVQTYKDEHWMAEKKGCSADDNFGYPDSPCFFIKVNKIYGWAPDMYGVSELPADMAEDLKEYIKARPADQQKQVWVSCWEEHGNDTIFEYPWGRGLPAEFFPYVNKEGYRSPLVAVKVTPPVNTLVTIRCRAWAKNIVYNKSIKEGRGYARIQLFVEADNNTEVLDEGTGMDM